MDKCGIHSASWTQKPWVVRGEEQVVLHPQQDGHPPASGPAMFSIRRFGDLESRGGNSWAGAASLTTNISGKARYPPCTPGLNPVQPLHEKPQSRLSPSSSTQSTVCRLLSSLTPSQGLWDVNHFPLSRLYFLVLKRAPILLITPRMKKICLFFWLRR